MAIRWMDDFSSYGVNSVNTQARMLNGLYAEATPDPGNSLIATDPDISGAGAPVMKIGSNGWTTRKVLPVAANTVGVLARYWKDTLPVSTAERPHFVSFRDVSNVVLCYLTSDPSGYLEAYNNSGTLIARSDGPVVIANAWRHMETKCTFSATTGSIVVHVEGVTALTATNVNTSPTGNLCQNIAFKQMGQFTSDLYIKDLIVWDGTGSSNNDFMGSCQVVKIVPNADATFNWGPSSGTSGWNLINEDTPSDDTGYISAAATPPAASEFALTDLPVDVTSVRGVMSMHRSRKTDGGDGNLQVSLVQGVTTSDGADRAITTAYTYWYDVHDQAPAGGNWSKSIVDALKIKVNRTL